MPSTRSNRDYRPRTAPSDSLRRIIHDHHASCGDLVMGEYPRVAPPSGPPDNLLHTDKDRHHARSSSAVLWTSALRSQRVLPRRQPWHDHHRAGTGLSRHPSQRQAAVRHRGGLRSCRRSGHGAGAAPGGNLSDGRCAGRERTRPTRAPGTRSRRHPVCGQLAPALRPLRLQPAVRSVHFSDPACRDAGRPNPWQPLRCAALAAPAELPVDRW